MYYNNKGCYCSQKLLYAIMNRIRNIFNRRVGYVVNLSYTERKRGLQAKKSGEDHLTTVEKQEEI